MSEHAQAHAHGGHKKTYFIIFFILFVLTVVEVLIPEYVKEQMPKATSLTALAVIKAFLVAYFFMHLNEEKRWLKFIAAIPIVAALYATMVCIESVIR